MNEKDKELMASLLSEFDRTINVYFSFSVMNQMIKINGLEKTLEDIKSFESNEYFKNKNREEITNAWNSLVDILSVVKKAKGAQE